MITVQRVGEDDWERVKRVRLVALEDAPEVFGSSIERERGFKESHWRMRLRSSDWWLARRGRGSEQQDVGLVGTMREPGAPADQRHLVGLWVDPAHRRAGVATSLLTALLSDVAEGGTRTVSLWLLDGNRPADAVYRHNGFVPTGIRTPLLRDPSRVEERWERTVEPTREGGEGHG